MRPHRPYELIEYDPTWKDIFLSTAEKIRPFFGDNLVSIEHIGSTAVEGMLAKPQVDLLVVVKDLDLVPKQYEEFRTAGYTPRGRGYAGIGDEYVTEDTPDGKRLVSIHIFPEGHPHIDEYRLFRDYLQSHAEERELYIQEKRRLYNLHSDNYEEYAVGKGGLIDEIKARARAER